MAKPSQRSDFNPERPNNQYLAHSHDSMTVSRPYQKDSNDTRNLSTLESQTSFEVFADLNALPASIIQDTRSSFGLEPETRLSSGRLDDNMHSRSYSRFQGSPQNLWGLSATTDSNIYRNSRDTIPTYYMGLSGHSNGVTGQICPSHEMMTSPSDEATLSSDSCSPICIDTSLYCHREASLNSSVPSNNSLATLGFSSLDFPDTMGMALPMNSNLGIMIDTSWQGPLDETDDLDDYSHYYPSSELSANSPLLSSSPTLTTSWNEHGSPQTEPLLENGFPSQTLNISREEFALTWEPGGRPTPPVYPTIVDLGFTNLNDQPFWDSSLREESYHTEELAVNISDVQRDTITFPPRIQITFPKEIETKVPNPTIFTDPLISTKIDRIRRKGGGRKGRMDPERAKKAREMRRIGACLSCRINKVNCSPGPICFRCSKFHRSLIPKLCTRKTLYDFAELLSPGLLILPLGKRALEDLAVQLSPQFLENRFHIDVTCGNGFGSMRLPVSEYRSQIEQLSSIWILIRGKGVPRFVQKFPAPVALRVDDMDVVTQTCRNYASSIARKRREMILPPEESLDYTSQKLFEVIAQFHRSQAESLDVALLDKAMEIYSMQHFMKRTISYTHASASQLARCLKQPTVRVWNYKIISQPFNRQLKSVMNRLFQSLIRDFLEQLENGLKSQSKSKRVWAISFCAICILCLCMEDIQVAVNGFVMNKRVRFPTESCPSIEDCIEICRKLDDFPFQYVIDIFHGTFKSRKLRLAHRQDYIYNPIRDGPGIDYSEGLDQEALLINRVRQIIFNHGNELLERSKPPSFDRGADDIVQYMVFRDTNSGRLLSNFLLSFHKNERG